MSLIWIGTNNGWKKMFDEYIYRFLMWVNHYSTKAYIKLVMVYVIL